MADLLAELDAAWVKAARPAGPDPRRRRPRPPAGPGLALPALAGTLGAGAGLAGAAAYLTRDKPLNRPAFDAAVSALKEVEAQPDPLSANLKYVGLGEHLATPVVGRNTGTDVMAWLRSDANPLWPAIRRTVPGMSRGWDQPWDDAGPGAERLTGEHYRRFAAGPAHALEQLAWERAVPDPAQAGLPGRVTEGLKALAPGGALPADPAAQKELVEAYAQTPAGEKAVTEVAGWHQTPAGGRVPNLSATAGLYRAGIEPAGEVYDRVQRYAPHAAAGLGAAGLGALGYWLWRRYRHAKQIEEYDRQVLERARAREAATPAA